MTSALFSIQVDESLRLALLTPDRAEELFALTDANRERLAAWLPWPNDVTEPRHSEAFIRRKLRELADGTNIALGIYAGDRLAGVIEYFGWSAKHKAAEIGYWLGEGFEGRGLMTRSCSWLVAYGFETLGLERIQIQCRPENSRSANIARRLGFTHEGTHRSVREWSDGRRIDSEVYSLLREEYEAKAET